MLYREIIAVCSEIHTKHTNTLCGQNVELLNVKLVVHIVTTYLRRVSVNFSFLKLLFRNIDLPSHATFMIFIFSVAFALVITSSLSDLRRNKQHTHTHTHTHTAVLPTYRAVRLYDIHLSRVSLYVTASHCHGLLQTPRQDCLQVHRVGLLLSSP